MHSVSFVTHANLGTASFRYRIAVPANALVEKGCKVFVGVKADPSSETVVFSKYWTSNDVSYAQFCRLRGQQVIFDICDDHFETEYRQHYLDMLKNCTHVVANSTEMQIRIKDQTGLDALLVEDPVTMPPQEFRGGDPSMCWYGNPQNVKGLVDAYPLDCGIHIEVAHSPLMKFDPKIQEVAGKTMHFTTWHPDIIAEFAQRHNIAFLPYRQGKNAKSPNRILEAIQSGMFVMADIIPSAAEIPGVWDLSKGFNEGIERYLSHGKEDVDAGKEYITRFYPDKIADQWIEVFEHGKAK